MNLLVKRILNLCSGLTPHTNLWQDSREPCLTACRLQAKDQETARRVYRTPFQSIHDR